MISVFPAPPHHSLRVMLYFCFSLLTPSFIPYGVLTCLIGFFFCLSEMKGVQCDKNYPEGQKALNFQQAFSCCCCAVIFYQLWVRASTCWRLQLFSKDAGLSP